MRSIRDDKEPSDLIQEKPTVEGWQILQISATQQSLKKDAKVEQLPLEVSQTLEPRRSRDLSNTALKSPQITVGTEGSILEAQDVKKLSQSGFLFDT